MIHHIDCNKSDKASRRIFSRINIYSYSCYWIPTERVSMMCIFFRKIHYIFDSITLAYTICYISLFALAHGVPSYKLTTVLLQVTSNENNET